ncbi:MAG: hypothetical protein RIR18_660 [Pseudomonadota bacterium]|jgi:hypothetical protein
MTKCSDFSDREVDALARTAILVFDALNTGLLVAAKFEHEHGTKKAAKLVSALNNMQQILICDGNVTLALAELEGVLA